MPNDDIPPLDETDTLGAQYSKEGGRGNESAYQYATPKKIVEKMRKAKANHVEQRMKTPQ